MPAAAARFFFELNPLDRHAAIDALAHVVDRERRHLTAVSASISTPVLASTCTVASIRSDCSSVKSEVDRHRLQR